MCEISYKNAKWYDGYMIPRLIVHRTATPFVSKYDIHTASTGTERPAPIAWASRRRLSQGEEITVYRDSTKSHIVWTITFQRIKGTHPRFVVKDPGGRLIGMFRLTRNAFPAGRSIQLLNANDQPTFKISESNPAIAVFRRIAARIPVVNKSRDRISALFDYHLAVSDARNEAIGKYIKSPEFDDNYEWHMSETTWQASDWRVIVSALMAIDEI